MCLPSQLTSLKLVMRQVTVSATMPILHIDDPLEGAQTGAIEVTVRAAENAQPRWCFFMTPEALQACGDALESRPGLRFHPGVPHMIIVSRIDAAIIKDVVEELERRGELLTHTAPIGEERASEEAQFLRAVQALRESRIKDSSSWRSDTIEDYLEAALAWAYDSDFGAQQGVSRSPWAKVRAFLEAGQVYE